MATMYVTYYCVRGMWGCTEQQTNRPTDRREKLKAILEPSGHERTTQSAGNKTLFDA